MTNNRQIMKWSKLWVHLNSFHSDYPIKSTPLWTLKLKAGCPCWMTMQKAGSDFKYLISKKPWKFKGISYHWIWRLHFKALHMFFPENTDYFLPCQIIKDTKSWYEIWRHNLCKMGHRWERKLKNKAWKKSMPCLCK